MTRPSVGKASDTLSRRIRSHEASLDPVPLSLPLSAAEARTVRAYSTGTALKFGVPREESRKSSITWEKRKHSKYCVEFMTVMKLSSEGERERERTEVVSEGPRRAQVDSVPHHSRGWGGREIMQCQAHCVLFITVHHQGISDSRAEGVLAPSQWGRCQRIHRLV